jgi:ABC-2 type transport system permease protein
MGPFFLFIYDLMTESSPQQYKICVVNTDRGITVEDSFVNYGSDFQFFFKQKGNSMAAVTFSVCTAAGKEQGIEMVRNNKADILIIIDRLFSQTIEKKLANDHTNLPQVEFIGDLTSQKYLISAVWINEMINEYISKVTGSKRVVEVKETPLGESGAIGEFDLLVPGILIISLIMLMFTASIAFVSEVENKTIIRLKLSKLPPLAYFGGISVVQLLIGVLAVLLTLFTAILLGFGYSGSLPVMVLVAVLTSMSMIAFSLVVAAITKSANEVLVVGCFPMFLFMFFSGAAFPMHSNTLFTIAGYPITFQGLMSPSHAISALNKTLIMNMKVSDIMPEIISIIVLSIIYFGVGALIFKRRHLRTL